MRAPALGLVALLVAGCGLAGDPKEREVRDGAAWARRMLARTQTDTAAGLSFASIMEGGGDVFSYLAASMPDGAAFTCFEAEPKPYCVAVKTGASEQELVIEGYGQDLSKPLVSERVSVGLRPRSARPGG